MFFGFFGISRFGLAVAAAVAEAVVTALEALVSSSLSFALADADDDDVSESILFDFWDTFSKLADNELNLSDLEEASALVLAIFLALSRPSSRFSRDVISELRPMSSPSGVLLDEPDALDSGFMVFDFVSGVPDADFVGFCVGTRAALIRGEDPCGVLVLVFTDGTVFGVLTPVDGVVLLLLAFGVEDLL